MIRGVLATLVMLAAAAPMARSAAPALAQVETGPTPLMIRAADEAARFTPAMSRIWPGYWPPDQKYIVYNPEVGALLVSATRPEGFQPIAAAALPRALRGRTWFKPGPLPNARQPFTIGYPLEDGSTAMLVFTEGQDDDELLGLIFHEQFHGYQRDAFKGGAAAQFVAPTAIPDRVAFASAAELERRLLSAALLGKSPNARRSRVHQYLAVREEREAMLPKEVFAAERNLERTEGTAKFVDRYLASLLPDAPSFEQLLVEELSKDLLAGNNPYMTAWLRGRSYGVGAAMTYLIRDMAPRDWRSRIEAGASPLVDQLAHASEYGSTSDRSALAASARREFDFDRIRAAFAAPILEAERREIKTSDDFFRLAPFRLALELTPDKEDDEKSHLGFAGGPGGMVMLGPAQLVVPDPSVVELTEGSASFSANDLPFMSESGAGPSKDINRYTLLLREPPRVNGRERLAPGEHHFETLDVTGPGLRLKVDAPVLVQATETGIRIRVL